MCYETILSGWVTFTRPPLQMRVCSLFTKLLFCISISSCSLTLKEKINVTSFSSISYYSNVWDWSHVYFTVVIQIPSFITPIRNLFFHGNLKYPLPLSWWNVIIQVNHSKHSVRETQEMEQRIFSFGIKEQLVVMLQNVNDVEQKSAPALQRCLVYVWLNQTQWSRNS